VTIRVVPSAAGTITNTASIVVSPTDPNLSNNSRSRSTTVNASLRTVEETKPDLTYTSHLDVAMPDGSVRGQILLNGHMQGTDNAAPHVHSSKGRPGKNRLEAHLEPGPKVNGFWRFDFKNSPSFVAGSFHVESGEIASQDGHSVVFVVRDAAQPIRFTFDLR
jgi:hypothetical protein